MKLTQFSQSPLFTEFTNRLGNQGPTNSLDRNQGPSDFGDLLIDGLKSVNQDQAESQSKVEQLLSGGEVDTAEVVTSIQKADMAFQLLVQVRNKLMKAYEEIQAINI